MILNMTGGSALKMELLWENASPTSNFDEQTIHLDLSAYDAVRIVSYGTQSTDGITDMKESSFVIDVNTTGLILGIRYYRFEFFARSVSVSKTGVHFELAQYKGMGADDWSGKIQKDICIPLRIYGIKGVSA